MLKPAALSAAALALALTLPALARNNNHARNNGTQSPGVGSQKYLQK